MVMKMTMNSVLLDTLQFIAQTLASLFREDERFDQQVSQKEVGEGGGREGGEGEGGAVLYEILCSS